MASLSDDLKESAKGARVMAQEYSECHEWADNMGAAASYIECVDLQLTEAKKDMRAAVRWMAEAVVKLHLHEETKFASEGLDIASRLENVGSDDRVVQPMPPERPPKNPLRKG